MICPECDSDMDSMGYGDYVCSNRRCNHKEYAESDEEF